MREPEERLEQFFINVKIKTMNHSIYDIIVNPLKTISSFQNQIQQKTAVPLQSQRLLYRGFVLDPDKTLADYRIEEGNIIQLIANKIPSQHSHQSSLRRSDITRTNAYNKEHNKTKKYRQLQERLNGFRMKKEQSLQALQQNKHTIDQLIECLNHNFIQDVSPFKLQRRKLTIGEWVDVRDASGQWIQGQVVSKYGQYVHIHYNGLHSRWNQWISVTSERIMPFRTHTVQLTNKTPYMSPFPTYERQISTKNNTNFQTTIETLVCEVTSTLDTLSNLMKELEFTGKDYMNEESLNNVSHLSVPQVGVAEVENEEVDINYTKQYFQTPGKDSAIIGDNISNKCEDDRSNKCDNDDVSSKKSFKSKRSQGLVDTASMKSLTIDESRKRQNKVFFDRAEEAQSVRSVCPKKSSKNFNFYNQDNQEYIVEETSQFEEQQYQEAGLFQKREMKRKMKASQLAPLLDRMGRFLIDIAPHIAMMGHTDQLVSSSLNENLSTYTNEGSLLSKLSQIHKNANGQSMTHSTQSIAVGKADVNQNNEQEKVVDAFCSFQVPIMLTPQELLRVEKLIESEKRNLHML